MQNQTRDHWNRRKFLTALSATIMGSATNVRAASAYDAWRSSSRSFDAASGKQPLHTLECAAPRITGRIPLGLQGTLLRNGPARFQLGTQAMSHWFDGDGMLQAFRFEDGKLQHRGVLLATPRCVEEEAAGQYLFGGFGSVLANGRQVTRPDSLNVANINVLPVRSGCELYALWEAGSAVQINPVTYDVMGFKVWSRDTAGAPFSAHPRVDPDGTIWNFGYMPGSGKLLIYHIGQDGQLKRQTVIPAQQADMVHDFAVTEHYLIFVLMPLVINRTQDAATLLDQYRWEGDRSTIVMTVDKRDWTVTRMELPACALFHIGNACEYGNTLRFGFAQQRNIVAEMQRLRVAHPIPTPRSDQSVWSEVELTPATNKARLVPSGLEEVEFPTWDQRFTGLATKMTVMLQRSVRMNGDVAGFDTLVVRRGESIHTHRYEDTCIAEEHIFVPRSPDASEGDGWILGTAYDWNKEQTRLSIFESQHVADGPIAVAELPYALPLGLHGQFINSSFKITA